MAELVVILGGGESGYGSALLARKEGFELFLSDSGALQERYREALKKASIPFEEGGHTMGKVLEAHMVVKSPGISETAPVMQKIRAKGIKVVSEIEFAGKFTKAKNICITGSNGKTTTTTLIYEMLREGGFNVGLAGNIGSSFALSAATADHDWYVLEISSFQLDDMYDFRADIAVLTNITPDHLDRYDYLLSKYIASKFRITQNQRSDDCFIYNPDDIHTMDYLIDHGVGKVHMMGISAKSGSGNFFDDGAGVLSLEVHGKRVVLDISKRLCGGLHNAYNYSQAAAAALVAGVPKEAVQRTIDTFSGIEHRVEDAGTVGGVRYINDSKATNVDAAWYALEAVKGPVVWIAGGTDKGNDYSQLYDVVGNVHTLVCMGLDNSKLLKAFKGRIPEIVSASSFEGAMEAAVGAARGGDTVLLSPACASFDLFRNYEDRGSRFKDYIKKLK